jgi:hypothetical protein
MQCAWDATGKQTLTAAGPSRLPEARCGLQHGKWPRKAGLILAAGGDQFEMTLQADRFQLTGVFPASEAASSGSSSQRTT